jgi:L-iditol 2-dehydrogenase
VKALVLKEYGRFEFTDLPTPDVGPREILIRVRACGICGSDVHGMDGSTGRRRPPIVMGHEAAGTIDAMGADAADWSPGDRVTFDSTIYCNNCFHCRRREINLCDNRMVLGVSCEDYRRDGAMAEYVAVPQHILYRLPDGVSFEVGAMVEPVSVAVHAVARCNVRPGEAAVVVGAGVIGLIAIQALKAAGCGKIVAVDVDRSRLELAGALGADVVLHPNSCDVTAEVRAATEGRGADIAVEAVGIAATVAAAIHSVRKGGTVALIGNLSPTVELPLQTAVTRELTLLGSCASRGEYPICLDHLSSGRIDVGPLISAAAPLADGPAWFQRLREAQPGLMKIILQP